MTVETSPAPAKAEMTYEEKALEQLKEQTKTLQSINSKLGFFQFITIIGIIFAFIGALM